MLLIGTSVNPTILQQAVRTYQSQLQAGKLPARFSDAFSDLEFEALKIVAKAANDSALESPKDLLLRLKLIHAVAILRDAQYSHASSRFVRGLGENGSMRSVYERAVAILNSTPIVEE
jgi:hypothetical protein